MRFDQTTEDNIEWIIYIATLVFTLSMSNHDQIGLNLLFMRIFKHSLHTKFDEVLVDIVIVKIKDNWYHFKSEFFIKLKNKLILRIPNFKVKGSISEETMKRSVVSIVFNLKNLSQNFMKSSMQFRVYQNYFFFSDWACIFIWHVYGPYKVPCKISDLWPQRPRMATTFWEWIPTIKKVIQNAKKVELLTLSPWRGSQMLSKMVWHFGF